jgi:hypothetical protein
VFVRAERIEVAGWSVVDAYSSSDLRDTKPQGRPYTVVTLRVLCRVGDRKGGPYRCYIVTGPRICGILT